jgi:hypothetical protein
MKLIPSPASTSSDKQITPNSVTPKIQELCRSINPQMEPYYVDVRPDGVAVGGECFPNVAAKIARDGGELITGWAIWDWPRVMVEAEFHGNWMSPTGDVIDITPKPVGRILFLPDRSRKYEGKRIDNVRLAAFDDKNIHDFIAALAALERLTGSNPGINRVKVTPELRKAVADLRRLFPIMNAR